MYILWRYWYFHESTIMVTWPMFLHEKTTSCGTCYHPNSWAASSEFVSSNIPSWQNLTAHAQSFRGARDLAFCLKVPLHSLLVRASSGGSGETARMRRLAWTFAACIGDKYQIRLTRPSYSFQISFIPISTFLSLKKQTFECILKVLFTLRAREDDGSCPSRWIP